MSLRDRDSFSPGHRSPGPVFATQRRGLPSRTYGVPPRCVDVVGSGFDDNALRHPFIPDAFVAGFVFFVQADDLRLLVIYRYGVLQAVFVPEQV